jgi:AraC-like DNA-binding protein
MFMDLQFTFGEILSLLGLVQCVYVLVYMAFRAGSVAAAIIPCLYFLFMGCAFLFDAAASRWAQMSAHYSYFPWAFWLSCVPMSVLLIFQLAKVQDRPDFRYVVLLGIVPLSLLPALFFKEPQITYAAGLVAGAFTLLLVWLRRDLLDGLQAQAKFGKERFWLIVSLLVVNSMFLGAALAHVSNVLFYAEWVSVRTLLGLAFAYIAATGLFRIYPQAFRKEGAANGGTLSASDDALVHQLKKLFEEDKVYQDPAFGRAELARELHIGEATLSRIVNLSYGKTIPQLLNEYRVADAQKLLKETDVPIQKIFEESGFNSITSFNRVFRELSGVSPTEYRTSSRA